MSIPQPMVSIITSFFNEERFLEEMIQSVLSQTFDKWELILTDDGSADKSTDIAKKYASDYPGKIHYFEHPGHGNLGLSASRNTGIQKARGELVAFLDADDILLPLYLENQLKVFSSTDAKMVCEATLYWYNWGDGESGYDGRKKDKIIPVGAPQDRLYRPQELNKLLYPLNRKAAAPCMCGIVVSREALLKCGKFENAFRRSYEDQVFLSKMYFNVPVYISSSCNNYYRQRTDSMMSDIKDANTYHSVRLQFLEWFESYSNNSGSADPELLKLVNLNLQPYRRPTYHTLVHVYPRKIFNKLRRIAGY